jgi:hypothetical protein
MDIASDKRYETLTCCCGKSIAYSLDLNKVIKLKDVPGSQKVPGVAMVRKHNVLDNLKQKEYMSSMAVYRTNNRKTSTI